MIGHEVIMIKTPSGRWIAIRYKSRHIQKFLPTQTTSLKKTPEEMEKTPMSSGTTLQSLKQHQDAIRKAHQRFLRSSDPHLKSLYAKERDQLLQKVALATEDNLSNFFESLDRYKTLTYSQ